MTDMRGTRHPASTRDPAHRPRHGLPASLIHTLTGAGLILLAVAGPASPSAPPPGPSPPPPPRVPNRQPTSAPEPDRTTTLTRRAGPAATKRRTPSCAT